MRPAALFRSPLLALLLGAGCASGSFYTRLTGVGGEPCSDLPLVHIDKTPEFTFHRIKPLMSKLGLETFAARAESLRRQACAAGADAVVEVGRTLIIRRGLPDEVLEGTAVRYTTRGAR